jgi:hypothetical protein
VAEIKCPSPALLLIAAFSRHDEALQWAKSQAEAEFGAVALESEPFTFNETDYYTATMGTPLVKRFFAFERLIDPARLAAIKCLTNDWERQYAEEVGASASRPVGDRNPLPQTVRGESLRRPVGRSATPSCTRPLNLDPGYLELAKLVLASTKDHAHRIYLGQGIHAEVTLQYRQKAGWQPQPWTFPDYRRADYHEFFDRCREYLHRRLREA